MDDRLDTTFRLAHRLRDIQLPDGVSTWPPAPGWWLLAFVTLTVLGGSFLLWRRRGTLRRSALRELSAAEDAYRATGDVQAFAATTSILLRRLAIALDGRRAVAGLTGEAWLGYLDRRGATDAFTRGPGRILVTLPYGGPGLDRSANLGPLVRSWIGRNA